MKSYLRSKQIRRINSQIISSRRVVNLTFLKGRGSLIMQMSKKLKKIKMIKRKRRRRSKREV